MSNQISAEILKDSINIQGDRLTTFRLKYHRYILSEINTHRKFSRNTSSSRAIPVKDQIKTVKNTPAVPIEWGQNQKGMAAKELIQDSNIANITWINACEDACSYAFDLAEQKVHKQLSNRLMEPFVYVDTILSSTNFNNFFNLRIDSQAQPEIQYLASAMYDKYVSSIPTLLEYEQWHLPYIDTIVKDNEIKYFLNGELLDLDIAIKISVSCCAQVSYRKLDMSVEKALNIYDKLIGGRTKHSSAFEHCATPFSNYEYDVRLSARDMVKDVLQDNISDIDLEQFLCKRNFKGWTQYRTIIPNDTFTDTFVK